VSAVYAATAARDKVAAALESRARLKVTAADYSVATAKTGTPTEVRAASTEVRTASAEVGTAAADVSAAAASTHVCATAAAAMSAAPPSTWTGGLGGADHEGRDRNQGQPLEGPAEKSCLSHFTHHGGFTPSLRALQRTRGISSIRRPATAFVQAPRTPTPHHIYMAASGGFSNGLCGYSLPVNNVSAPRTMTRARLS
jgi:hypothetical protein